MQKIYLLLVVTAMLGCAFADEPELDDNVYVLTDANFDEFVSKQEFLLVEFYAPWCGHCKALAPEYAKAAKRLRENNPPYYLAKVDATENKEQSEKHGIRGFPTLFFYKNGQRLDYNGGRTENEIVNWILKRVGPPSSLVDCEGVKKAAADHKLVLTYFGEGPDKSELQTFLEVAGDAAVSEKFQFVHTFDKDCAAANGAAGNSVSLFRQFDESPVHHTGAFEKDAIIGFAQSHSVPTVIEFSEDYIEPIFGSRNPALFLLRGDSDKDAPFAKVFEEAAHKLKGEILFVTSGVTEGIQQRLGEFIGVTENQLPTLRLLDPSNDMKKYVLEGDNKVLTVEKLKSFIDDFKAGKLSPFLKSEDIPEDNSTPVKVIVGKTYNDMVLNSPGDVFVKYYAPWCGHCKKLAPVWDQLAEELKDVPGLVIAKFDATANEVDGLEIRGYPTLKFYNHGKQSTPVDYDGERDIDGFKTWLKNNSEAYKKYLENKSDL